MPVRLSGTFPKARDKGTTNSRVAVSLPSQSAPGPFRRRPKGIKTPVITRAVGESSMTRSSRYLRGLDQFQTKRIGYLAVRRIGRHRLSATAAAKPQVWVAVTYFFAGTQL